MQIGSFSDTEYCQRTFLETLSKIPLVGRVPFFNILLNCKGTMLAHGVNEKFVGEDFMNLMDSDKKFFIKDIVDTGNTEGSGWVQYKWFEAVTKKWLPKTVYFEKVDDVIICSGFYDHKVVAIANAVQNA